MFPYISACLWKQAIPIHISKTGVARSLSKSYDFHCRKFSRDSQGSVYDLTWRKAKGPIFVSWKTCCNYHSNEKSQLLANLLPPLQYFCHLTLLFDSLKNLKSPQQLWVLGLEKERLFLFSLKPVVGRVTKNSVCCFGRYITLFTATHMLCSFWCKGEHQKILGIWSWVQHSVKHTF